MQWNRRRRNPPSERQAQIAAEQRAKQETKRAEIEVEKAKKEAARLIAISTVHYRRISSSRTPRWQSALAEFVASEFK